MKTLVIKFGGASVANLDSFSRISDFVIAQTRQFDQVIVVISAMGDTTDQLVKMARAVNPSPPKREYDMLVTVGERISISLLAMALAAKGYSARSFTGSQSGILTSTDHANARILSVEPKRLVEHFGKGEVLIVAGFQGMSVSREITTLGRGGSDITAVALGVAFQACHVEFVKDVQGIYDKDLHQHPDAKLFPKLSYQQALQIVEKASHAVLHPRSILLAQKNSLPLFVRSFHTSTEELSQGTWIAPLISTSLPFSPIYEDVEALV